MDTVGATATKHKPSNTVERPSVATELSTFTCSIA
jgi:hypothetical protein